LAAPFLEVTVDPTLMVPLLVSVLDEFPEVCMPVVFDAIVPLLVMVTGPGPVDITPGLVPVEIVPLFVSVPPPGRLWVVVTVVPAGMVVIVDENADAGG
jgi:hypothetical protein